MEAVWISMLAFKIKKYMLKKIPTILDTLPLHCFNIL